MKIGIFGDSFADETTFHTRGIDPETIKSRPWAQLVRESGLIVDNYAKSATSLYYSYLKFLEHHNSYDKIIFTVTGPGRLYLPHLPEKYHHTTAGLLMHYRRNIETDNDEKIITAFESYYKYLCNFELDITIHNLMYEKCQAIRPDALFLPCFQNSIQKSKFHLDHISYIDYDFYNVNPFKDLVIEKRHCHMNRQNNIIFADKIIRWINNGKFEINIDDFQKPEDDQFFLFDVEKFTNGK